MWVELDELKSGLSADAPLRIGLVGSLCEWSRAGQDRTQADKGANTDEAHRGHRGSDGDP